MGACTSKITGRPAGKYNEMPAQSEKSTKSTDRLPVKILLLGASGSGKTTIFKQMRLVHHMPFSRQEIESYRQLIYLNVTDGLQSGISRMNTTGFFVSEENRELLRVVENCDRDLKDDQPFPSEYHHFIEWLWRDPNVQAVYRNGNEAGIPENLSYYSQNLDRLFDPHFQPNNQDILHAHVLSTGITETTFPLQTRHDLVLVDVGGSKSERRKWRYCAEGASAVLFVVNLAGYNQFMREDEDTNQMEDALALWEKTCRDPSLANTVLILLLNKCDLFEEKIAYADIKNFFPDYKGPSGDPEAGRKYFRNKFRDISREIFAAQKRNFHCHYTTATNTMNIRLVMASVQGTIFPSTTVTCFRS
ncbi:heterotrimeric G protein alpha subunit 4 [Lentinus tigrinus ALCF2SS1-6]|uniref:Heterotrimeric G protein alpha subunit 4 n=1 Tax=Lentinus tigrinus ALCF2SS1-6 TaxID=1328759 RepID=A0A5C2RTI0_9APHY|nr:heterotrimeric G protein alpha subunit 4 [Lentinus tigrinus ALCF2SS1-6]